MTGHEKVEIGGPALIDPTARLIKPDLITIGTGSRIDSFALITAGPGQVVIGRYVHVAAGVYIFGTAGVEIGDYVNLSGRVILYSTADDFTDGSLAGPLVPEHVRKVTASPVTIERHALIGAGSIILPGVTLGMGCAVGALSLVDRDVAPRELVAGIPIRRIGERGHERLERLDNAIETE